MSDGAPQDLPPDAGTPLDTDVLVRIGEVARGVRGRRRRRAVRTRPPGGPCTTGPRRRGRLVAGRGGRGGRGRRRTSGWPSPPTPAAPAWGPGCWRRCSPSPRASRCAPGRTPTTPAAAALAASHGFARVRELWVMRRPSSTPLDPATVPDGVVSRRTPTRTRTTCSPSTPRPSPPTPSRARWTRPTWPPGCAGLERPAGLLLARDAATGELLGFHWTKRSTADLGEVYVLGIAPAAQAAVSARC